MKLRYALLIGGVVVVFLVAAAAAALVALMPMLSRPTVQARPGIVVPDYAMITDLAGDMTDAQWDDYAKALRGGVVKSWHGWVTEVEPGPGSTDRVRLRMREHPSFMDNDRAIRLTLRHADAVHLRKDGPVEFGGIIEEIDYFSFNVIVTLAQAWARPE